MSYVDAIIDRERERIHVVERVNGNRLYKEYPVNYQFYYEDPRGKWLSIYGTPVTRVSARSSKEFRKELSIHNGKKIYESDINPIFKCLAEYYQGSDSPELQVAFFDIETDFDAVKGYSTPEDPFTKVTAITVYLNWLDQLITLAIQCNKLI